MNSIAVIDSGIDINFKEFKKKQIEGLNIHTYENSFDSIRDYNGHGTACIAEILRVNPRAEIKVIKLLNEKSQSSVKKLIDSIEYASDLEDVRIISISASTFQTKYLYELKKVIEYANKKNKLLICSSDNRNKESYPSYMEHVVGVQRTNTKINGYRFDKKAHIQCICEAKQRLLPNINRNYKLFGGNSYSTAYFCGVVSKLIEVEGRIDNDELLERIRINSEQKLVYNYNLKSTMKIKNEQKKYDYFKLSIIVSLIIKFLKIKPKDIFDKPIYRLIGLNDIYFFLKYISKETNELINYTNVTHEDLLSIYSLYNLIFKDE